ncbi:MAG: hypothetical protein EXS18_02080 [Verrucomicrobiae bacterium]|nr:hypothetical protein [Verrucomicrobiae bacterium]
MKQFRIVVFTLCLCASWIHADNTQPPEILPVDAIKPGMTGTTYTVMQGTKIDAIHTEIFGVLRNAIGPGHHLIIARLNDEKTKLTFAVHGMSGSPLYVDGKIAGALSRRVSQFEKDAFCGFTPIQDMLDVDNQAATESPKSSPAKKLVGADAWFRPMTGDAGMTFQPLLTPLVVAGLSPRAFSVWAREFRDSNFLSVMGAGGGGENPIHIDTPFNPGAPVSALLVKGAINVGGTGTMTYRNGNKMYAFGHPMFGFGSVQVPMARAEIIATIPSYLYPYKISNIGQVIGTITQDRLTAICGEVGEAPHMIPMTVEITGSNGKAKTFQMELFDHPQLTPYLVRSVFASITLLSLDYSSVFSMAVDGEIELNGLPSVKRHDFYSGDEETRFESLFGLAGDVDELMNSSLGEAKIKKVHIRATIENRRHEYDLEDVWINSDTVKRGETVTLRVTLRPWQGEPRVETISIPLPEELKGGEVKLLVGDADSMRRAELGWGTSTSSGKLDSLVLTSTRIARENPRTLTQLIEQMNKSRPHNYLYYRLSVSTPGQLVQNQRLTSLPPSSLAVRESKRSKEGSTRLSDAELFEKRIAVDGVVTGSQELTLKIE